MHTTRCAPQPLAAHLPGCCMMVHSTNPSLAERCHLVVIAAHYPFITQRRPRQDHKSPTSTAFLLRSWRVTPVRICRKLAIVRRHSSLRRRASCLIIVAAKMSAICCDRFVTVGSVSELSFRRRPSSCLRWLGLNGMSASGAAAAFLEVRRADDSTGTRRGSRGSATTAHDATNTTNTRTPRPSCISKLPLVRLGRTALSPAAARDRRLLRRRQCRACCAWPSRLRATVCLQIRCRRCPCRGCVCAKGLAKCSGSGAKRAAAAAVCRCRCVVLAAGCTIWASWLEVLKLAHRMMAKQNLAIRARHGGAAAPHRVVHRRAVRRVCSSLSDALLWKC